MSGHDYTGETCGLLYVIRKLPEERINRERAWECKCTVCGSMCKKSSSQLRICKVGCPSCSRSVNLRAGDRYHMLVAQHFVEYRAAKDGNHAVWLWQCDCGNTIEARADIVMRGDRTSCGCKTDQERRERAPTAPQKSGQLVEGTFLPRLKKNDLLPTNTSGYRGVYYNNRRQKWVAQIYFKGKQIVLGAYDDPAKASDVYQQAKAELHGGMLAKYGMTIDDPDKK